MAPSRKGRRNAAEKVSLDLGAPSNTDWTLVRNPEGGSPAIGNAQMYQTS